MPQAFPNRPMLSPSSPPPSLTPTDVQMERSEGNTDFGFAIPVQDALWIADQLRAQGRVDRAYLGVRLESAPATGFTTVSLSEPPVPPAVTNASDAASPPESPESLESRLKDAGALTIASREGALLREVLAGTPASQAGLRPGDRIVSLDGHLIRSAHDLIDRLDRIPARRTITLGLVRRLQFAKPAHLAFTLHGQPS